MSKRQICLFCTKKLRDEISELKYMISSLNHEVISIKHDTEMSRSYGMYAIGENVIVAKLFSGIKLFVDPRDLAVVPHLVLDGVWEDATTKAWLRVANDKNTVLDIGANFGYFGFLASQLLIKRRSKIFLFEANPNLEPYLRKSLLANWLGQNTKIISTGISDNVGELKLNILKNLIGSSSMQSVNKLSKYLDKKMPIELSDSIKVPVTTIDRFLSENKIDNVDLIKIDIEGFEERAYRGMKNTIKNSPNLTVFLEFTKEGYENPMKLFSQIQQDFNYMYIIDEETGDLKSVKKLSYEEVIGKKSSWVMLVASKVLVK